MPSRDIVSQGVSNIYNKKIIISIGNQISIFQWFTITDKFSKTLSIISVIDYHFDNIPRLFNFGFMLHE